MSKAKAAKSVENLTFIDTSKCCTLIGCSKRTLYRLMDKGLPFHWFKDHVKFMPGQVVEWIAAHPIKSMRDLENTVSDTEENEYER